MEICWIQLLLDIASFLQDYHVIHNMLLLQLSLWSILLLLHQHGKHYGSYEVHNFQWKLEDEVCSSLTFSSNFRLTFGSTIGTCNSLFLHRSFKALLYFLSKSVCVEWPRKCESRQQVFILSSAWAHCEWVNPFRNSECYHSNSH